MSKYCKLVYTSAILCLFGVKRSGFGVFLVSAENGAGVNKMTNIRYAPDLTTGNTKQGQLIRYDDR